MERTDFDEEVIWGVIECFIFYHDPNNKDLGFFSDEEEIAIFQNKEDAQQFMNEVVPTRNPEKHWKVTDMMGEDRLKEIIYDILPMRLYIRKDK